jgi:NTE family protein
LSRYDPDYGYKPKNSTKSREAGDLLLLVTFSGGGTRAAAFSYGVLEALRDTRVLKGGRELRLLDEVDLISGVSGGSFTAAYYGLFGDRTFQDFEPKFLKKDIQGDLSSQIFFNPANWTRLFSPYFDRSDLAAEYYDKNVFEGATFADLAGRSGPMILINATDMVYGTRVAFNQDAFDIICSDLSAFPVARACAASSAVPILLTPITLKNYAGSCNYVPPEGLRKALEARDLPDRQFDLANNLIPFMDSGSRSIGSPSSSSTPRPRSTTNGTSREPSLPLRLCSTPTPPSPLPATTSRPWPYSGKALPAGPTRYGKDAVRKDRFPRPPAPAGTSNSTSWKSSSTP